MRTGSQPSSWTTTTTKRRVFLEHLGKALVTPHIQRRERLPRTEASAALVKAVQGAESCPDPPEAAAGSGKRRRCQFCPPKKDCKNKYDVLHM